MSMPEPMRCLADECPSPLRCSNAGGCIEAQRDGAKSYTEALAACRLRRVIPESWRGSLRNEDADDIAAGLEALKDPVVATWPEVKTRLNLGKEE